MVAIPLDKINYNKVSKFVNVLIFKEFYPKTKNVSYYVKVLVEWISFEFDLVTMFVQNDMKIRRKNTQ